MRVEGIWKCNRELSVLGLELVKITYGAAAKGLLVQRWLVSARERNDSEEDEARYIIWFL